VINASVGSDSAYFIPTLVKRSISAFIEVISFVSISLKHNKE
jgi:hypothetical protein